MIVGHFGCYKCGEGRRGGLCVNFPLPLSVVMMLFWFWCGECFFCWRERSLWRLCNECGF